MSLTTDLLDQVHDFREYTLYVTKNYTGQSGIFYVEQKRPNPGIMVLPSPTGVFNKVAEIKDGFLYILVSDKPIRDWVKDACRGMKLRDPHTKKRIR